MTDVRTPAPQPPSEQPDELVVLPGPDAAGRSEAEPSTATPSRRRPR